jgi:Ni,Fe-hydrogenase I small subunit
VVWLHFAECTGCSEAFLRTSYPNVDDILLDTISLEYHETLMAAAGKQAEECLEKALADFPANSCASSRVPSPWAWTASS